MNNFTLENSQNGLKIGQFQHFYGLPVRHGFSTRIGGVSRSPYSSLNLGLHTGDDPMAVKTNRQMFSNAVDIDFFSVVTAEQTHSDNIALVTNLDAGRGCTSYDDSIKNTDALITNTPNLPLMLFFADCVPVMVLDPIKKAIAVIHAGWKGTVAKIAQKTILKMQEVFGTVSSDCLVGIGPSIGPCCYEVDRTVVSNLKHNFTDWNKLVEQVNSEHWKLNLWMANKLQLEEVGVNSSNIIISGLCTACNTNLFFSHRAEHGRTGRLGAVISLL